MSPPDDQSQWDERTEEYERPLPITEVWPGDGQPICRVAPRLRIDVSTVSVAAYLRFLRATGRWDPVVWVGSILDENDAIGDELIDLPQALLERPAVMVSIEDARAYGRWAQKRLPLDTEWHEAVRSIGFSNAGGGLVWEWTASRHRTGHIVRGGRDRRRLDAHGHFTHRSWEDEAVRDVGFRCVVDG